MKGRRTPTPWTVTALVLVLSLMVPWAVLADTFVWDGDVVTAGNQTTVDLGAVSPGAIIINTISFQLQCAGKQHVDQGQTVGIAFNLAGSAVPGGGSLSATSASIGAIPPSWPDDTTGGGSTNCPSPAPLLDDNGNSLATITAPTTPGSYTFVVAYSSSLSPGGSGDPQAITGPDPSVTFNLVVQAPSDTTPPTISCTVPDQTIWYATDQSVPCTASDPSGATPSSFTLNTSVLAGTETASALTSTPLVCDGVGNCATAGPYTFKIDKKAPSISCGSADGTWYATDQSVSCTATDSGSGPTSQTATLSTSVPAGTETDSAYTGTNVFSDNVGNSATAGPVGPFKIDKKAPSITITTPSGGYTYTLNQAVAANYSCADGGSGVALCSGPVANGSNIDTGSVGSKAFTVNATDVAGNAAAVTNNYSVIYDWIGFFRPVDNLPTFNQAKAGSAIPVKFSLSGNQGLGSFPTGAPKSALTACDSTAPVDAVEETATAGGSSLSYDPLIDQYVYVWKTDKAWTGCRQLLVKLDDGMEYRANFKFTK